MHGLANDFVILDERAGGRAPSPEQCRFLANRRRGVGCDQVIYLQPSTSPMADIRMRIFNADGGEVETCGNATRCVGALLMNGRDHFVIESAAGLLDIRRHGDRFAVDMGLVRLDWLEIPLAQACDTLHVPLALGPLSDPVAVNVGNPHAVFFVADCTTIDLEQYGPMLEHHALFPQRANIEIVTCHGHDRLRMRVWERGVGITAACGTGACAALVAAHRRGLTGRRAEVELDGGRLEIEWLKGNHVLMTGPASLSFHGEIDLDG
jgi:diaminopimelate epimerase